MSAQAVYQINQRNKMIHFGYSLGQILLRSAAPVVITLDGSIDSGKSLLALAIHRAFEPGRYGRYIRDNAKADSLVSGPVVFQNFRSAAPCLNTDMLNETLARFMHTFPGSSVYIASNLDHRFTDGFNQEAQGLGSELLDASIMVKRRKGFVRTMRLQVQNEMIENALPQLPFAFRGR